MTQEDRELLIKDLSARLPYGVKAGYKNEIFDIEHVCPMYEEVKLDTYETWTVDVSDIKPYLFPLSSMSEEERTAIGNEFAYGQPQKAMDILHKRHIDYRGLIPLGLAIDATGLNIY